MGLFTPWIDIEKRVRSSTNAADAVRVKPVVPAWVDLHIYLRMKKSLAIPAYLVMIKV